MEFSSHPDFIDGLGRQNTPPHLQHCTTETIPGKSFVERPPYPEGGEAQADPRHPLTYLASPYSHADYEVEEERYKAVTRAAAWLIKEKGWNVFSPITHSHPLRILGGLKGNFDFWKRFDTEYLSVARRLVVLQIPGWEESVGVTAEIDIATAQGTEVLFMQEAFGGYILSSTQFPSSAEFRPTLAQQPCICGGAGEPHRCDCPCSPLYPATVGQAKEDTGTMRTFSTGATRDTEEGKPDYEGFLSPLTLASFGRYMVKHQRQADGNLRPSDNWQKGIPLTAYMKSTFRHFVQCWTIHRGLKAVDEKGQPVSMEDALCALMFNVMGYLHEYLKKL